MSVYNHKIRVRLFELYLDKVGAFDASAPVASEEIFNEIYERMTTKEALWANTGLNKPASAISICQQVNWAITKQPRCKLNAVGKRAQNLARLAALEAGFMGFTDVLSLEQ